jgi:hypothetical protein
MKYQIFPQSKPQINDLVWWLNPQLKEVLGYYKGFSAGFPIFIDKDKQISKFSPKYWRNTSQEDELLIDWHPDKIPPIKKSKKK